MQIQQMESIKTTRPSNKRLIVLHSKSFMEELFFDLYVTFKKDVKHVRVQILMFLQNSHCRKNTDEG